MKKKLVIVSIFILAFTLRFYKLGLNPPSLYWDETINCYDAFSLGQTGKDHHGLSWPLAYLTSYGDFKNPLYTYLDILPVRVLGLNEFSCRLPSALFGWLTVIVLYFLVKELFKTQKSTENKLKGTEFIAITASLLLAVSPWHLQFSRAGFEANINLFLITLGLYLFIKAINHKSFYLVFSAIVFALTPYAYHSSKMFMPLLVSIISLLNFKFFIKNLKWSIISFVVGGLIIYPLTTTDARKAVLFRFTETNIFNEEEVVLKSNKLQEEDHWSLLSKIFHNRRIYYAQNFLVHYFDHFNFKYLFLTGDANLRHSTQAVGEFYLIEFPFMILGFYYFLKNKEKRLSIPLIWLFLSIVPASFTITTPHAIRTLAGLGSWQIITAYGAVNFFLAIKNQKTKKLLLITNCLLLITCIYYYLHSYYIHYPPEASSDWQYGYKKAVAYIKDNYNYYDKIIISNNYGRAYAYLLFYLKYPPEEIQKAAKIFQRENQGYEINKFDKFEIGNINYSQNKNQSNILLIGTPGEFPRNLKPIAEIKNLKGEIVFKIIKT